MDAINNWALKFVRWGMGLSVVGLVTGYFPLGHYLMMGAIPSCPAAPVHGHAILLSLVGMTMFGLAYRALPAWMGADEPPVRLVRMHFWLSVIGVLGVVINGTIGYEFLSMAVQPRFYYIGSEGEMARDLWFGMDGLFLTLYGIGCAIFLYILMKKTSYAATARLAA
jgi:nitric oxide reductase large subunit